MVNVDFQKLQTQACVQGVNRLICSLKNVPFVKQNERMQLDHVSSVALDYIVKSNGIIDAVWCLRYTDLSDETIRRFAVSVVELVSKDLPQHYLDLIECVRDYTDGYIGYDVLHNMHQRLGVMRGEGNLIANLIIDPNESDSMFPQRAAFNLGFKSAYVAAFYAVYFVSSMGDWQREAIEVMFEYLCKDNV
ncbi:MAG: hypothetical protein ACRC3J_05095 [Culicoidibacterales bacterium]